VISELKGVCLTLKEALFYKMLDGQRVACLLCPNACVISEGNAGDCLARRNIEGKLLSVSYGQVTSFGVDPVEKKPLYHFYPGHDIVSFGSFGCNLHCLNCQNYRISQFVAPSVSLTPEALYLRASEESRSIGIAATYNEPTVNFEYVMELFRINRKNGGKNVLVTNGYLNPEPWALLLDWTDAVNLDIKSYEDDFYARVCRGKIKPILSNLDTLLSRSEVHAELTWLLIEGENDAPELLSAFAAHVASLRPETPLHISRYYPNYKMNTPETRPEALFAAQKTALQHLPYVYVGNLAGNINTTNCKACSEVLVSRRGYEIEVRVHDQRCPKCGALHFLKLD
jgi:pyruvate formate lyase activating enzyme